MTFKIHLPKCIRVRVLKPASLLMSRTDRYIQQVVPPQNRSDGAGGRNTGSSLILQRTLQLAATPSGVLSPERNDDLLNRCRGLMATSLWPLAPVFEGIGTTLPSPL
jgi:hypothetical protein